MDLVEVKNRKSEIISRHPWELARFEIVNSLLQGIIKNDEDFNVLDIGCGDIFFVSKLNELYPKSNFYAIDIAFTDEIMESYNEMIAGKNIYLFKSLEEASVKITGKADLVLLLDVVEHIENDVQFLSDLNQNVLINDKTTVIITVPAYQKLFCTHDYFLGHYRRYTNKTLIHTVEKSGFHKSKIGYFFLSLIFPRIIQVIKEKIIKPDLNSGTTGLVEWNKSSGLTGMIKSILLLDFRVTDFIKKYTGITISGLSNYIICKRRV